MNNKKIQIAPSVLSGDFVNMEQSIRIVEDSGCKWLHLDIMDGAFVPPITFGHQMVKSIRNITDLVLDVHLMINSPENQIDFFAEAGADYATVHIENTLHTHRIIQNIKARGMKAGVSIVPSTPVSSLVELLPFVDLVLVMTVNPGFGGQKMIPQCVEKVRQLDTIRQQKDLNYLISVDGGVNRNTVSSVIQAGTDIAVCGSAFFGAKDKKEEVIFLQSGK